MNSYIQAQIINMITMTKSFEQGCRLAAMQDDGKISSDEVKIMKKITTASEKFRKELESIK